MLRFNHSKFAALVGLAAVVGTVFAGSCVLSSCTKSVVDVQCGGEKSHVVVDVRTFSMSSEGFGTSWSSGTKADDSAAGRLSFAVFDSEGSLVDQVIHQVSSDGGFSSVEMDLYPGDYQMVAVAHGGEADAVISSVSSVVLPGRLLTDTFAKVQSLTVESGEDCSLGMTLPRVTSAFVLRLTDTPAADADEITIVVNTAGAEPSSLKFSPSSGLAENNWKFSCSFAVGDFAAGDVPVYFMSMYPVSVVNIEATAYDIEGSEIISHSFNNVSLTPNKKTIATGAFFKSHGSGVFTLDTVWYSDNLLTY